MKKLYMGTNTKMFKTRADTTAFLRELHELTADISRDELELFVIPSFTTLESAAGCIPEGSIRLGAQSMGWAERGQLTGEISPLMLDELGVRLVMIGHSERRHVLHETDEEENRRVLCALEHGFTTLLCIGETGEEKSYGISDEVLRMQLKVGLHDVRPEQLSHLWIAYEPVWAIGVSGVPASAEYAAEKHAVIRRTLVELFGAEANEIPLLYGGSVNPDNAVELIVQPEIDGLFIGRSAWVAPRFNEIIRSVRQQING